MNRYLIFIFLLFGINGIGQINDTVKISPNIGLDEIRLMVSRPQDVIKFRGLQFKKSIYVTIRCGNSGGKRSKFTSYYNDSAGIEFEFKQQEKSRIFPIWSRKKLTKIEISKGITLSEYLKVGQSTKENVLNVYGPLPAGWNHENYIYFEDKGIAFNFNADNILTSVIIYIIS